MSRVPTLARLAVILILTLIFAGLMSSTTATATSRLTACSPVPTPEIMSVEPVTSPTTLLSQTLQLRLGNGRQVTVTSEAGTKVFTGTFSSLSQSALPIPLLPNVTHHVMVAGQVEYQAGCYYLLTRAVDKNGAPLTIMQLGRHIFLPVILRR